MVSGKVNGKIRIYKISQQFVDNIIKAVSQATRVEMSCPAQTKPTVQPQQLSTRGSGFIHETKNIWGPLYT